MLRLLRSPQLLRSSLYKTPIQNVHRRANHTSGVTQSSTATRTSNPNTSSNSDWINAFFMGLTMGPALYWGMYIYSSRNERIQKEKWDEEKWKKDVLRELKTLQAKMNDKTIGGIGFGGTLGERQHKHNLQ
ncbi:uncharacterized protein L199_001161 [Kwoniella botswanensis]|uniref:uncharacterized protein n=1 Tax=Kwoniella botswanensis TaxID=1268659 RepID=UPI00315DB904